MLQKIRSAALILTFGSFLVLGLTILVSETIGFSFLPNWPWIYAAQLVLLQGLIVGLLIGVGALVGVSVDIWTEDRFKDPNKGKPSKSYWFAFGALLGLLSGMQALDFIFSN